MLHLALIMRGKNGQAKPEEYALAAVSALKSFVNQCKLNDQ